jgi:hypothetical protein
MWMKMMAFGATASILALSACAASEDEYAADAEGAAVEDDSGEASLEAKKKRQSCGGKIGLTCPAGYACEDNPRDGCDPALGGRDCGGVCVKPNPSACRRHDATRSYVSRSPDQCAATLFVCEKGKQQFFDECGCGCETVVGTPCGNNVCGPGESCCNASCGWCRPEGMMCIQIACTQEKPVAE